MATENPTSGEMKTRETKTRIKENTVSTENYKTAEERATGQLIAG